MDKNEQPHSSMMWLMMICCLAPVLLIWLAGRGIRVPTWGMFAGIAFFIGLHFILHRRHAGHPPSCHGHDTSKQPPDTISPSDDHAK